MESLDNFESDKSTDEYIEKLKINYYSFIKRPLRGWSPYEDEAIINDHQKEEYVAVFKELLDTSLKNVQCLTEEETNIIRKYIGVYDIECNSLNEIAENLGLTYGIIDRKIRKAYEKIYYRILRGFVNLEEAVLNGDISKDEICGIPIDILFELSPKMRNSICYIDGKRINTIGELIDNSIETIKKSKLGSSKNFEKLVDYIHSLGLNFKDEINYEDEKKRQVDDWYKYVGFNDNMGSDKYEDYNNKSEIRQSIRLKLLLEKLKVISEQDEIYDKEINKIMIKKQELQKSKMEILNEMLNLQPEITSEEENDTIKKVLK